MPALGGSMPASLFLHVFIHLFHIFAHFSHLSHYNTAVDYFACEGELRSKDGMINGGFLHVKEGCHGEALTVE